MRFILGALLALMLIPAAVADEADASNSDWRVSVHRADLCFIACDLVYRDERKTRNIEVAYTIHDADCCVFKE